MKIEFDEREHCYSVDGDIAQISVTELLHKHGLAPSYNGVRSDVLKQSAEIGKAIHKDIENTVNGIDYEPTTACGIAFNNWQVGNLNGAVSEQMLALDYSGMVIAGTADLFAFLKNDTPIIGDHKVVSKLNRDYVSWQVSLLDYMARRLSGQFVNGRKWVWKGAKEFYCFHFNKNDGTMKVVRLDKIADSEIERLIEAEFKGEIYKPLKLIISREDRDCVLKAEDALIKIEEMYKQAKASAEEWREKLCSKFDEQGIDSWEYKGVRFTRVPSVESITVDAKALKANYPQVYSQCTKLTKKRAYIKVTRKSNEDF